MRRKVSRGEFTSPSTPATFEESYHCIATQQMFIHNHRRSLVAEAGSCWPDYSAEAQSACLRRPCSSSRRCFSSGIRGLVALTRAGFIKHGAGLLSQLSAAAAAALDGAAGVQHILAPPALLWQNLSPHTPHDLGQQKAPGPWMPFAQFESPPFVTGGISGVPAILRTQPAAIGANVHACVRSAVRAHDWMCMERFE